ncbi:MAG: hypothetical protein KJ666_14285 [Bacteroidetes bacterium]|nr:hypothetical protein [Bacteroidota bacterium]MBU2586155.1 hypothetical protein [Bacteroidota bacterium]
MKKRLLVPLILFLTSAALYSQVSLHSINFFADYSYPLKTRLAVTKIDAVGGGVELRFDLSKTFSVSLTGGYNLFSLQQDSAIKQWNWRFYTERYLGIIKDNLRADSSLAATLSPIQKMDLIPLFFTFGAEFNPFDNFYIKPQIGSGIFFNTRRLYLEETWRKKFDAVNYTFEYSYRNFATNKYGNPISAIAGLDIGYKISEAFIINSAIKYFYFFRTPGKLGFDQFPVNDYLNFKLGLTFLY